MKDMYLLDHNFQKPFIANNYQFKDIKKLSNFFDFINKRKNKVLNVRITNKFDIT